MKKPEGDFRLFFDLIDTIISTLLDDRFGTLSLRIPPFDMHEIGLKKRGVISVKKQKLFERSEFFCFRRAVHFLVPRSSWLVAKNSHWLFSLLSTLYQDKMNK